MSHLFEFDPAEVLGVPHGARLSEVREAYRAQTKRHHPDVGGDAWAFRLVNRAYELLCCSRVAGWMAEEERREQPAPSRPPEPPPHREPEPHRRPAQPFEEDVRRGAADVGYPADRMVAVEVLVLRHEIDNPVDFLMAASAARNLSCTVSAEWPKADAPTLAEKDRRAVIDGLILAFRKTARAVRPGMQKARREDGRFSGWLTYDTARDAHEAASALRQALHEAKLGMTLTTRELVVPRP